MYKEFQPRRGVSEYNPPLLGDIDSEILVKRFDTNSIFARAFRMSESLHELLSHLKAAGLPNDCGDLHLKMVKLHQRQESGKAKGIQTFGQTYQDVLKAQRSQAQLVD